MESDLQADIRIYLNFVEAAYGKAVRVALVGLATDDLGVLRFGSPLRHSLLKQILQKKKKS